MTRLQPLLSLRQSRHRLAEDALLRQQVRCEAARAAADAARAQVVAQQDLRERREAALLAGLVGQAVSRSEIERIRITLAALDEHVACLARAHGEARQALQTELDERGRLAEDRNRRRREVDKLSVVAAQAERASRRRRELITESEQDDRVHGVAPGWRRP